jgi:hypothetical protein
MVEVYLHSPNIFMTTLLSLLTEKKQKPAHTFLTYYKPYDNVLMFNNLLLW